MITDAEQFSKLEAVYLRDIAMYEAARRGHLKTGRLIGVECCDRHLARLYAQLKEIRAKHTVTI